MKKPPLPRWVVQSLAGAALVAAASLAFNTTSAVARQDSTGSCPAGFAMKDGKCEDIDECKIANGGCDTQTECTNTPGSRTCGACPEKLGGSGYQGCFDVNDCPEGDCSKSDKVAPLILTSGDVTVAATSSSGAAVNFTAAAIDGVDGARSVRCTPAAGSNFPVGSTTVSCFAADKSGNSRTVQLKVTVKPAQFP